MGLFDQMTQTQDLLNEALTDQERKDRAIRKNLAMIVQQAITTAQLRSSGSSEEGVSLSGLERIASEHGDVVFRSSFVSGNDVDKARVVREVQRVLKQAGVDAQAGLTTRGNLKVVVDRGYFAQMGGTNPMDDLASRVLAGEELAEMHDVTATRKSQGSTKRMLPAHKAKMKQDQEDAVVRRAADQAAEEASEDEEVFESLQPYGMKRDQTRFELDKLRIEGPARRVSRAKMLWKKKEDDGTFTERWMYLAQSIDDLVTIKRKILAGTDIPVNKTMSPDGKQGFALEQFGDIVWMTINGVSK